MNIGHYDESLKHQSKFDITTRYMRMSKLFSCNPQHTKIKDTTVLTITTKGHTALNAVLTEKVSCQLC